MNILREIRNLQQMLQGIDREPTAPYPNNNYGGGGGRPPPFSTHPFNPSFTPPARPSSNNSNHNDHRRARAEFFSPPPDRRRSNSNNNSNHDQFHDDQSNSVPYRRFDHHHRPSHVVVPPPQQQQPRMKVLKGAEFSEIIRNLYVGAQDAAYDEAGLIRRGITHVINLATNVPNVFSRNGKIKYLRINILDTVGADIRQHFQKCFAFIDDALQHGGAVLVHCNAGISRSVTVCIAYIMHRKRVSFDRAFTYVKDRRRQANPNVGFLMQLQHFEKDLKDYYDKKATAAGRGSGGYR